MERDVGVTEHFFLPQSRDVEWDGRLARTGELTAPSHLPCARHGKSPVLAMKPYLHYPSNWRYRLYSWPSAQLASDLRPPELRPPLVCMHGGRCCVHGGNLWRRRRREASQSATGQRSNTHWRWHAGGGGISQRRPWRSAALKTQLTRALYAAPAGGSSGEGRRGEEGGRNDGGVRYVRGV